MNEWPRAISTTAIWISIGISLGFGLFKMNFSGGSTIPPLLFLAVLLVVGGVAATAIVWGAKPVKKERDFNAARPSTSFSDR